MPPNTKVAPRCISTRGRGTERVHLPARQATYRIRRSPSSPDRTALGATASPRNELVVGLDACKYAVEHYEELWERPADRRTRMLAIRDAANRFLADLGEQRLAVEAAS